MQSNALLNPTFRRQCNAIQWTAMYCQRQLLLGDAFQSTSINNIYQAMQRNALQYNNSVNAKQFLSVNQFFQAMQCNIE